MATYASLLRVKLTNSFLVFLYGIACSWFGRYIANGKKEKKWKGVCVVGVVFKGENTFIYFYIHFLNIYILFYSFTVFRKRFLRRLLGTVENGG